MVREDRRKGKERNPNFQLAGCWDAHIRQKGKVLSLRPACVSEIEREYFPSI